MHPTPRVPSIAREVDSGADVEPCKCYPTPGNQRLATPTRDEVLAEMNEIAREVASCFKHAGRAQIAYEIEGESGHVNRMAVLSGPPGDETCLSRAFTRICFRPFQRARLKISFLFKLNGESDERTAIVSHPECAARGYSISTVEVSPADGSRLIAGALVRFSVTAKYELNIAARGTVALVFEDEANRLIVPGDKQVREAVAGASGQITLTDEVIVPKGVREVRLFVPLKPEGKSVTHGGLLFRYPVTD
jgi:hypothetical protein